MQIDVIWRIGNRWIMNNFEGTHSLLNFEQQEENNKSYDKQ